MSLIKVKNIVSDILLPDISDIVVGYITNCEECYDFKKKLYKYLSRNNYTSTITLSKSLFLHMNNLYNTDINIEYGYSNIYGNQFKTVSVSLAYLSMLLVHNLEVQHILYSKPRYDIYNKSHHYTCKKDNYPVDSDFNILINNLNILINNLNLFY